MHWRQDSPREKPFFIEGRHDQSFLNPIYAQASGFIFTESFFLETGVRIKHLQHPPDRQDRRRTQFSESFFYIQTSGHFLNPSNREASSPFRGSHHPVVESVEVF
jgi:hypothetical protein